MTSGYWSNDRCFLILAPDLTQRIAHLAEAGVGSNGIENGRHQVAATNGDGLHAVEGDSHGTRVSTTAHLLELARLRVSSPLGDIERVDR